MKNIKDFNSYVNHHIKESVDVELDSDIIDYFIELKDEGLSDEEAIEKVSIDLGIDADAVSISVEEAGVKESKKEEKKDKGYSKEDEEKYLSAKQRKLPDGLKAGIIKKAKKKDK